MIGKLRALFRRIVRRTLPTDSGLMEQTVKSGVWAGAMNVSERALEIGALVVLASLLDPRDFGLMGIALLTLSIIQNVSQLGLDDALIQAEEADVDSELDTYWVLKSARGIILAGILFAAAPAVGGFFSEPRAVDILAFVAVSPLLMGLKNPGIVYFEKDLDFHRLFLYRVSGTVVYVSVAVGYALVEPTVWALALAYVGQDAVRLVMSYLMSGYRPSISFDLDVAKRRYDFGKWVTGRQILYLLYSRGDDAFIGWALSATALGYYQLAYRLSNAPATEVTHTISSVTFPAYSKAQHDLERLREGFLRTVQLTTFISFPVAVGIAVITPSFVRTFLGPEWLPMVLTMQLLAAYGLLRSLGATFGPVWKAIGRPDYVTKLSFIRVVLLAAAIYPVTMRYGIEGVAGLIVAIYIFPMMPLDLYVTVNAIETTYGRILREVAYPLAGSLLMGLVVVFADDTLVLGSQILEFIVLIGIGAVTYTVFSLVMVSQFNWGLERTLSRFVDVFNS